MKVAVPEGQDIKKRVRRRQDEVGIFGIERRAALLKSGSMELTCTRNRRVQAAKARQPCTRRLEVLRIRTQSGCRLRSPWTTSYAVSNMECLGNGR